MELMENLWIPIEQDVPADNRYVLVSFANFDVPGIGRYEEDGDGGGSFYPGDDDESYLSAGIIPNAWMPLPDCYRD